MILCKCPICIKTPRNLDSYHPTNYPHYRRLKWMINFYEFLTKPHNYNAFEEYRFRCEKDLERHGEKIEDVISAIMDGGLINRPDMTREELLNFYVLACLDCGDIDFVDMTVFNRGLEIEKISRKEFHDYFDTVVGSMARDLSKIQELTFDKDLI